MTFELLVRVQCIAQVCIKICLLLESLLCSKKAEIHIYCSGREMYVVFLLLSFVTGTGKLIN